MPTLNWKGQQILLSSGQTVLEALLNAGVEVSHSCRAGACQSCLIRAKNGPIPAQSQTGLKPSLVEQGYLLACMCRPQEDLVIEPPGQGVRSAAKLIEARWLSPSVLHVGLELDEPLNHRAGQYITLFRPDGLSRSYSIASLPSERIIQLHVRVIPTGQMSNWLADTATPGTELTAQGPAGNCFYTADSPEQPLLLVGTGTGLAPLYGIALDALQQGHTGPIRLYHGALNSNGLYLVPELEELSARHANFQYLPALLDEHGPLPQFLQNNHPKLHGWRGFVCGDPQIVSMLKKRLFLAGMASRDIYSDSFVPTSP